MVGAQDEGEQPVVLGVELLADDCQRVVWLCQQAGSMSTGMSKPWPKYRTSTW